MSYIYFFDKSSWKRFSSNWKTLSNFYWKTMISYISGFFTLFFHQILSPDKPVNQQQTARGCYPNSFRFRCPFHVVFISSGPCSISSKAQPRYSQYAQTRLCLRAVLRVRQLNLASHPTHHIHISFLCEVSN